MTDAKRSYIMSRIKARDTVPELLIRSLLHRNGFRFRLYSKKLPGKPDIVLPKYKTVIDIRGCFWHAHQGCPDATLPATRTDWWAEKLARNAARDVKNVWLRQNLGWRTVVIWGCALRHLKDPEVKDRLTDHLVAAIKSDPRDLIEITPDSLLVPSPR